MFDQQPDPDPHGECAAEIHRLEAKLASIKIKHEKMAHFANEAIMCFANFAAVLNDKLEDSNSTIVMVPFRD